MKTPELPDTNTPLTLLYQRHLQRDPEATTQLYEYFAKKLNHLAQQILGRRLAARVDGEDVTQEALNSFLKAEAAGKFHVNDRRELWNVIVAITRNKALLQVRFHLGTAARSVDREAPQPLFDEAAIISQLAIEPTEDDAIEFLDVLACVTRNATPEERLILELYRLGHSEAEIVARTGKSKHTVKLFLKKLTERMGRYYDNRPDANGTVVCVTAD